MIKEKEIREALQANYMPHEIEEAMSLILEIQQLKKEKNAIVLSHNYMTPDIFYGTSDIVGDSLHLAREAQSSSANIILVNGVHFMAETVAILNPEQKVLIADLEAGCSLAESITAEDVQNLKKLYPNVPVVTYINCSASVKAETDICCTSANAFEVIESLDSSKVIFLPDDYLAKNIAKQSSKEILSWEKGKCMVHELYSADDISASRKQNPNLMVVAHPECPPEVTQNSDFSGSTSQMANFIQASSKENILLLTECSMSDNLRSQFPNKNFISTCHTCPHMKRITLKKVKKALVEENYEINVPLKIMKKAIKPIERMLAL